VGFETRDYTALERITWNGANAAFPGDAVTRNQVLTMGLKVGVQVRPERNDLLPLPGKTDGREVWAEYALNQGAAPAEIEDLSRPQLVERYGGEVEEPGAAPVALTPPSVNAKKADWVAYAQRREPGLTEDDATKLDRDELVARYNTGGTLDTELATGLARTQQLPDPDAPGQPRQK
jgi:hypothetical protein